MPGDIVSSYCRVLCRRGLSNGLWARPPSYHLAGWNSILISFLKISFLTVPHMAFLKEKKVFVLPPTTSCVLNRRKTKTQKSLPNQRLLFLRHHELIAHGRRKHLLSHDILSGFLVLNSFLDPLLRFVFELSMPARPSCPHQRRGPERTLYSPALWT